MSDLASRLVLRMFELADRLHREGQHDIAREVKEEINKEVTYGRRDEDHRGMCSNDR